MKLTDAALERTGHIWKLAGGALERASQLEQYLGLTILLLAKEELIDIDVSSAQRVFDGNDRRTLGELVHFLRQHVAFGREQEKVLFAGVRARNYLVHGFFRKRDALDSTSFAKAAETVQTLWTQMSAATELIIKTVDQLWPVLGIPPERIHAAELEYGKRLGVLEEDDTDGPA